VGIVEELQQLQVLVHRRTTTVSSAKTLDEKKLENVQAHLLREDELFMECAKTSLRNEHLQ
jgi:hypothetical protein